MMLRGHFLKRLAFAPIVPGLLIGATVCPVAVQAGPVQARPAHQFVNSVGVATHFAWSTSPYRTRYAETKAALKELGIRHIRDAVGIDSLGPVYRNLNAEVGVKLCAVIDARKGNGGKGAHLDIGGIAPMLSRARKIGVEALAGLEGPNEYNQLEREHNDLSWIGELRQYQAELRRQVKADSVLRSLPVIAPSMADPMKAGYYTRLGDLSGSIDRGNAHVYPNWLPWSTKMADVMPYARILAPSQPLWATETGYHMAYNSGAMFVREDVLMKYLTRAMASFSSTPGVERAYFYQLMDTTTDPGRTSTQAHFGLIDSGMRRKLTYYAVRNLMHTMCDDPFPSNLQPGRLSYSLTGNLADVRAHLFQKRNRAFYLVMYADKQSFKQNREVINPPQAVRIRFEQGIQSVRVYRPSDQAGGVGNSNLPKQTYAKPNAIDLNITDAVTVLEIVTAGNAVPTVSTSCSFAAR